MKYDCHAETIRMFYYRYKQHSEFNLFMTIVKDDELCVGVAL